MNQVKKNYIYSVMYQILLTIIPIITIPYISRTIGSSGIGVYSYTYSIVNYFMHFSMLGINNYGNRSVAKARDNKEKLSKIFKEIYVLQCISSITMIFIYFFYVCFFSPKYMIVTLLQTIYLVSCIFDLNWFFFGLEKFKLTVIRNIIIKLVSLLLIFMLVKSPNDLWLYTLILSGGTLISNLFLIPFLFKEIYNIKISFIDVKKHIKPVFILFIPTIAITLYKIMDKIMLGIMSVIDEVGYYEQAEKIINAPLGLITALGVVMLPRMSNLVAKGNNEVIKKYIKKSIDFMMFLVFPLVFGLIAISSDFVPIFLGKGFDKSIILLKLISCTMIFITIANIIRTQYLIPKEKDKIFICSTILGAVINIIINALLIPYFQSIGACIGTIVAEFSVMMYQVVAIRKELSIKEYLKDITSYLLKSLIMFVIIIQLNYVSINPFLRITIQITFGMIIYFSLNYKYIYTLIKELFRKEGKK